jgi:hypothetical protein
LIVAGEGGGIGVAIDGGEGGGGDACEDGGHEAQEFFAIEVLLEGGGVAVEDAGAGFVEDPFSGGSEEAIAEVEVFVVDGSELFGEAAGGEKFASSEGEVEGPGVAEVIGMAGAELVVKEDGGGFGEEGVEGGGVGRFFPGSGAEDEGLRGGVGDGGKMPADEVGIGPGVGIAEEEEFAIGECGEAVADGGGADVGKVAPEEGGLGVGRGFEGRRGEGCTVGADEQLEGAMGGELLAEVAFEGPTKEGIAFRGAGAVRNDDGDAHRHLEKGGGGS